MQRSSGHRSSASRSASRSNFSGYSRSTVTSFLYYYSDMQESGGRGADYREGRSASPGPPNPIAGYITDRIDDDHQHASYEAMMRAVEDLKILRWHLWMRIEPLYFRSDNNPTLLDVWQVEADSGSRPDEYALGEHEDAVNFVLSRAEELVKGRGYDRLKLDLPDRIRGERARKNSARRKQVVETLCEAMDEYGPDSPEAIKQTARETGYSPKQLRLMRREIRGEE